MMFLQLYSYSAFHILYLLSVTVCSYLQAKTRASEIILRARNYSALSNKNYNGTNPDVGKKVLVHE
jgi:hypothetical protein